MIASDFAEPIVTTPILGYVILGIIVLGIDAGFGFWAMSVYRHKGKPPRTGFLLGFLLSLVLSVVGGALALYIAYRLPDERLPAPGTNA